MLRRGTPLILSLLLAVSGVAAAAGRSGKLSPEDVRAQLAAEARLYREAPRARFRLPGHQVRVKVTKITDDTGSRSIGSREEVELLTTSRDLKALNRALWESPAGKAVRAGRAVPIYYRALGTTELNQLLRTGTTVSQVDREWRSFPWRGDEAKIRAELKQAFSFVLDDFTLAKQYRTPELMKDYRRSVASALRELPRQLARAKGPADYMRILGERAQQDPAFAVLLRAEHFVGGTGMFNVFKNLSENEVSIPNISGAHYHWKVKVADIHGRAITSKTHHVRSGQSDEREVNFFGKLLLEEVVGVIEDGDYFDLTKQPIAGGLTR